MNTTASKRPVSDQLVPTVHLEFIHNKAGLPQDSGLVDIEAYHRAIFLHQRGHDLEQLRQEAVVHEERLSFLHHRWKEIQERLQKLEQYVPVPYDGVPGLTPSSPWNHWDRFMFLCALLAVLSLLAFGVLNISFNLLESGLVTFMENPMRAYFWAALLPVGAFGVKIGWDFLPEGRWRNRYVWTCLALGMLGVLVWVGAYSTVYPTLSKTITDHLETLSVFDTGGPGASRLNFAGVRGVDMTMVFAQAVAEVFLSAVLGIYMTLIYLRHRPIRLGADPVYAQLDQERLRLEREIDQTTQGLAAARGRQTELESQLSALTAFAKSIYEKETVLRREQAEQKEALLDQISQHLRTQLEAISSPAISNRTPTLPLRGQNGK